MAREAQGSGWVEWNPGRLRGFGFDVRRGGPPVAFDAAGTGSASVGGSWRALGAARCGHVLGAASGVRDAGGGVTPTRVDPADTGPSEIAAAWRNGPIGVLRRTILDITPRNRSADAVWRNGPVGVLQRRGWSHGARWG